MKTNPITVRFPTQLAAVERGYLNLGQFQRAQQTLTVNSQYLELDGEPVLPVMGEFHFSRYPATEWERELRKMRAGGVTIVASYVIWNHHEEIEGCFDWAGARDLRRFVTLAAKVGLKFYLRPGPWVHGEVRNGGFPDWLLAEGCVRNDADVDYQAQAEAFFVRMMETAPVRCNDAAYLARVKRFYGEIGAQLRGLMWADGGPVIGVQLENEYHRTGPGCGAEHIAALKRIAIEAGLTVPLYTVTGWPTLDIPAQEVVPVSGAYADGFWQGGTGPLAPSGVFVLDTNRSIGEMGNVGGTPADGRIDKTHYPFFLAEAGGGMHVSYHRRPVISADDLAATALVQVGSGANLYGYYMYHGGTNPKGQLGYLNETQDTGYPNDVALLGYDFHAPLGQYGQMQPSYGRLRALHTFLADFGANLAPQEAALAEGCSIDPADMSQPRVAVRGAGSSGYVFVNNYIRHYPTPDFADLSLRVVTTVEPVQFPPLCVPSGAYFIYPVGQRIGAATLRYATVQALAGWQDGAHATWVAFRHPANPAQLCFEADGIRLLDLAGVQVDNTQQGIVVNLPDSDAPQILRIADRDGTEHCIVILSQALADQAYRMRVAGRERLLLCAHSLYQCDDALVLDAPADALGHVQMFPADDLPHLIVAKGFAQIQVKAGDAQGARKLRLDVLRENAQAPAVRFGPPVSWRNGSVPQVPQDAAFEQATVVRLVTDDLWQPDAGRVMLKIDYVGDVARLYADGELVDDRYYDGEPWYVGLDRYARNGRWPQFELKIIAAPADLPIFLEEEARRRWQQAEHPARVLGVSAQLWCEHRLTV